MAKKKSNKKHKLSREVSLFHTKEIKKLKSQKEADEYLRNLATEYGVSKSQLEFTGLEFWFAYIQLPKEI